MGRGEGCTGSKAAAVEYQDTKPVPAAGEELLRDCLWHSMLGYSADHITRTLGKADVQLRGLSTCN